MSGQGNRTRAGSSNRRTSLNAHMVSTLFGKSRSPEDTVLPEHQRALFVWAGRGGNRFQRAKYGEDLSGVKVIVWFLTSFFYSWESLITFII